MSEPSSPAGGPSGQIDNLSVLFAQLVMQQANMALMLLGKVKNPQTGESVKDLEAARLFIDELEMLEVKTKGNLAKEEAALLKQTLMSLRLAFVQAVDAPEAGPSDSSSKPANPEIGSAAKSPESAPAGSAAADEDSKKKFTKKY